MLSEIIFIRQSLETNAECSNVHTRTELNRMSFTLRNCQTMIYRLEYCKEVVHARWQVSIRTKQLLVTTFVLNIINEFEGCSFNNRPPWLLRCKK